MLTCVSGAVVGILILASTASERREEETSRQDRRHYAHKKTVLGGEGHSGLSGTKPAPGGMGSEIIPAASGMRGARSSVQSSICPRHSRIAAISLAAF
jgi:hypothetical protein